MKKSTYKKSNNKKNVLKFFSTISVFFLSNSFLVHQAHFACLAMFFKLLKNFCKLINTKCFQVLQTFVTFMYHVNVKLRMRQ